MDQRLDGFQSLGSSANTAKMSSGDVQKTEPLDELSLEMSEEELVDLSKKWKSRHDAYIGKIARRQKETELYWKGKYNEQRDPDIQDERRPISDNQVFMALETFLPIATRQNPEPLVYTDDASKVSFAKNVRDILSYQADRLSLKIQLKKMTRFWSLYFLGVAKVGWSKREDDVALAILRPQRLIIDPEAVIDNAIYYGEYIGEERSDTAEDLVSRFPKKESKIKEKAQGAMGTKLVYHEWWTQRYVFWTLGDIVLDKRKNPHWNYEEVETVINPLTGIPEEQKKPGRNHFNEPQFPYIFLSIYNLGTGPFDETNAIYQILGLQDLVDKRLKQIDRNADNTNGGAVVSGNVFSAQQAAQVSEALRKGGTVIVPGNIDGAYRREMGPPLPNFVYQSLNDCRSEMRNVFGIAGSTPQGIRQEQSVRGKIIARNVDSDRIGGGFSEYLEQVADRIFNWMVQLMMVYYDREKTVAILGKDKGEQVIAIKSADFVSKLTISVKENSMIPKDPLTKRNEAIEMWQSGAIDPISLYEALDFPNPYQAAERLFVWKSNPQALFPSAAQLQSSPTMPMAPPPGGPPAVPPPGPMADQLRGIMNMPGV